MVYAPQKGASLEKAEQLDKGLFILSKVATKAFGYDVSKTPGAGAAGGVGAGAMWFLNATLEPGASIVLRQTQVEEYVREADLVITGEGKIDKQTLQGKLVLGLAEICANHHVPIAAVCGTLDISPEEVRQAGLLYAVSCINRPLTLEQAQKDSYKLIREATFHLLRLFFFSKQPIREEIGVNG
jgi:glycerate 2-kinase